MTPSGKTPMAVFRHQAREFSRDGVQWFLFVMFPVQAVVLPHIMENSNFDYPAQVAKSLAVVFAGGPLIFLLPVSIARDREKGYLSEVKPAAYVLGTIGFYVVMSVVVAAVFAWLAEVNGRALLHFMFTMLVGCVCSALIGTIIGLLCRTKALATGVGGLVCIVVVLLLKVENGIVETSRPEALQPVLNLLYFERLPGMMMEIQTGDYAADLFVILANAVALAVIVGVLLKLKGIIPTVTGSSESTA